MTPPEGPIPRPGVSDIWEFPDAWLQSPVFSGLEPLPLVIRGVSHFSSPGLRFHHSKSLRPSNFKPSLVCPPPVHCTLNPKLQGSLVVGPSVPKFKFSLAFPLLSQNPNF